MWRRNNIYDEAAVRYDAFIRQLVPVFDTMQQRVVEIIGELLGAEGPETVIELGVGTGSLGFRLLSTFAVAEYFGYEVSHRLLAIARSRLSLFKTNTEITQQDPRRNKWPARVDAVVSSLTFHYFSHEDKQKVFRKAFRSLRAGGLLVVGDRVISRNSTINTVYHDRMVNFWDATTRNWTPEHREAHKTQDDPREEPWFLEDQLESLKEVGFTNVECIWKDFNYCVFCGIKPELRERTGG